MASSDGISFYFFDFDDNIMFLSTSIFVRNTVTGEKKPLSTGDYANVHPQLGNPGDWEDWAEFDGTFSHFRDVRSRPSRKQHFVQDVEAAIAGEVWKAPSWDLFVHACEKQRPVSIVTARGHSPATIKAGVRLLVEKGLLPREPKYHTVFPVSNEDVRREQLDDPDLSVTIPVLKKRAIIRSVETALDKFGHEPPHRFGMSDDDPKNVNLIISAMCECKKRFLDKRFFVINTHFGQHVKLEVYPVDFPVTGKPGNVLSQSPPAG